MAFNRSLCIPAQIPGGRHAPCSDGHIEPIGGDVCLNVVDANKCTACEDCVDICPKNLFSIQPVTHQLWVACKNLLRDEEAEAQCEVACTGCEKCAKDAPSGLIQIKQNLARVDYSRNDLASPIPIQRCPTGAIVWLDMEKGPQKGSKAKNIVREEALPF